MAAFYVDSLKKILCWLFTMIPTSTVILHSVYVDVLKLSNLLFELIITLSFAPLLVYTASVPDGCHEFWWTGGVHTSLSSRCGHTGAGDPNYTRSGATSICHKPPQPNGNPWIHSPLANWYLPDASFVAIGGVAAGSELAGDRW